MAAWTLIRCSFLVVVYGDADHEDNQKTVKTGVRLYSSDELDHEEVETPILHLPVESEPRKDSKKSTKCHFDWNRSRSHCLKLEKRRRLRGQEMKKMRDKRYSSSNW